MNLIDIIIFVSTTLITFAVLFFDKQKNFKDSFFKTLFWSCIVGGIVLFCLKPLLPIIF